METQTRQIIEINGKTLASNRVRKNVRLSLYNTLTKKREIFVPIDGENIRMYACGITVSGFSHIGHARQAIVYDIMRNFLQYLGYGVTYVRNFTDVDDKIIDVARKEGKTPTQVSEFFIEESINSLKRLKVKSADHEVKVTDHIKDIIEFVQGIISKGYAYIVEGEVFFDVRKFENYGKLSGRHINDQLCQEQNPRKKNPEDFSLWKPVKQGEPYWESPWGQGRPGWHIECSALAYRYLGECIDIHGGGVDLVFPHHENEIAQTESLTGKPFANYWLHNGLININGQKMSKSLGNFITIQDILERYQPDVIRFAVLGSNFTSPIDFTEDLFKIASKRVFYFYSTLKDIDEILGESSDDGKRENFLVALTDSIESRFSDSMNDNFNFVRLFSELSDIFSQLNIFISSKKIKNKDKKYTLKIVKDCLTKIFKVIGIFDENPLNFTKEFSNSYIKNKGLDIKEIERLIQQRKLAKEQTNYQEADSIRDILTSMGIKIKDTPKGMVWDIDI